MALEDRDLTKAYPRAQFAEKLRRLADAIETEKPFTIEVAGERLRIPASAIFNIEHERADGEEELEFQLIWSRGGANSAAEDEDEDEDGDDEAGEDEADDAEASDEAGDKAGSDD